MAKLVSVIFNEDGNQWAEYLQAQLSNSAIVNSNVFLQRDTILFGDTLDSRSQTHILNSSVVIVILTPGHIDFLHSKEVANYGNIVPNTEKGIMFFVGLKEEQLTNNNFTKKTRKIFPNYDSWSKVNYVGENSIMVLIEEVVKKMAIPDPTQTKFTLIPTRLQCEEETTVVVLMDKAIPENAVVEALISGTYIDENLTCERANPYSYTFKMPKHVEDEVTVTINVDKQPLGSQVKISYRSYISCSEQTAINEIYCHMLDKLCSYMKSEMKTSHAKNVIDMKLSEIFDHTVDLPAIGYEKLFGIYQYLPEENSRTKLPNLVHLGAEHDLKELVARLQDLPNFIDTLHRTNSEKKNPRETAQSLGFIEMAEFLEGNEKKDDIYYEMVCGKKYQNVQSRSSSICDANYEDVSQTVKVSDNEKVIAVTSDDDDDQLYMPMNKPFSEPTGVSSEMMSGEADLITMLAKYRRGEFLQEDMEMKFIIWQNKYFATSDNSFKTKQAMLKKITGELHKVKSKDLKVLRPDTNMNTKAQTETRRTGFTGVHNLKREEKSGSEFANQPELPPRRIGYLANKHSSQNQARNPQETSRPKNLLETNEPIGRNFGPRYPIGSQEIWHRNSNRSSGSSTASRTSSASVFSGRGSLTSCSSGLEEDFDPGIEKSKSINEKSFSGPSTVPRSRLSPEPEPEEENVLSSVPLGAPPPIPVFHEKGKKTFDQLKSPVTDTYKASSKGTQHTPTRVEISSCTVPKPAVPSKPKPFVKRR